MNMYELPEFKMPKFKIKKIKLPEDKNFLGVAILALAVIALLFSVAYQPDVSNYLSEQAQKFLQGLKIFEVQKTETIKEVTDTSYVSDIAYEQAIINAVKSASPSVVSIVISKNLPVYEQQWINPFPDDPFFNFQIPQRVQKGTQKQDVGAGSGFIVSTDGLVLTNKHVVQDKAADYTVITNDHTKYPAKVLALDPVQDLAVIKIQTDKTFPSITLGDSSGIQIGQTAIAIGNALGQFSNTVSVGIVSGLSRTISASDQGSGFSETLQGIIQTDAAINSGNSGGPLLNLKGEVIGINTAMAQGAESIGFAIPINMAKRDIDQVSRTSKIVYPFLGVRYVLINSEVKDKYKLSIDYGAYILKGQNGEAAITAGSAAEKVGLKEKDIILELNGEKITSENPLSTIINKFNPGDKITLKILRSGTEQSLEAVLGER